MGGRVLGGGGGIGWARGGLGGGWGEGGSSSSRSDRSTKPPKQDRSYIVWKVFTICSRVVHNLQ